MIIYYILEEISYGGSEVVDSKFYSNLEKAKEELEKLCRELKGNKISETSFSVEVPYHSSFYIYQGKLV